LLGKTANPGHAYYICDQESVLQRKPRMQARV
jgi:hypothetical protein